MFTEYEEITEEENERRKICASEVHQALSFIFRNEWAKSPAWAEERVVRALGTTLDFKPQLDKGCMLHFLVSEAAFQRWGVDVSRLTTLWGFLEEVEELIDVFAKFYSYLMSESFSAIAIKMLKHALYTSIEKNYQIAMELLVIHADVTVGDDEGKELTDYIKYPFVENA